MEYVCKILSYDLYAPFAKLYEGTKGNSYNSANVHIIDHPSYTIRHSYPGRVVTYDAEAINEPRCIRESDLQGSLMNTILEKVGNCEDKEPTTREEDESLFDRIYEEHHATRNACPSCCKKEEKKRDECCKAEEDEEDQEGEEDEGDEDEEEEGEDEEEEEENEDEEECDNCAQNTNCVPKKTFKTPCAKKCKPKRRIQCPLKAGKQMKQPCHAAASCKPQKASMLGTVKEVLTGLFSCQEKSCCKKEKDESKLKDIDACAKKRYEACLSSCQDTPSWEELTPAQKLRYHWLILTSEEPRRTPFENFCQWYVKNLRSDYPRGGARRKRCEARMYWRAFGHCERLPFILLSLIYHVVNDKIDVCDHCAVRDFFAKHRVH
ncbi:uncharacterized protein LOC115621388 [Scaptodrosophila lebanonensis]|uniref:Uncharacterized protein LOC115621388 n=1 Tax=Drosophila lebanonensis TaxID=7225 RepID=A0A6J2T7H3_DROLE|nr:uncharacterized protein LOC115621388 [Scaptodrosophila lebanonensis]